MRGATAVIDNTKLLVTDVDQPAETPTYTIRTNVTPWTLQLAGATLGVGAALPRPRVDAGKLRYTHDGSEGRPTVLCSASRTAPAGRSETRTFHITIRPINEPPANTSQVRKSPWRTSYWSSLARQRNGLSIADVDAGGAPVHVELIVNHGTLTLAARPGSRSRQEAGR